MEVNINGKAVVNKPDVNTLDKINAYIKEHDILAKAHKIVFDRSGEQAQTYGSFDECNKRVAGIASILCNKEITERDMLLILIALKLGREAFMHKEDNLLDLVAYTAALNNYHEGIDMK